MNSVVVFGTVENLILGQGEVEGRPRVGISAVARPFGRQVVRRSWSWEAPERQAELLALSRASNHADFASLDKVRQCQIHTNHANLLNTVGRTIDAIAIWDKALKIIPGFAMAWGNRGCGIKTYAGMVVDDRERAIMALHAFDSLRSSIAEDAFDSGDLREAAAHFAGQAEELAGAVDIEAVRAMQYLDHGNAGRSKIERAYRRWCLEHRLFLCPLNDLGPHLAAAIDDLMLPPLIEGLNDRPDGHLPPPIIGFFSQMKQEYASARFMLFEGTSSTQVHFSDRRVALTDTLNYPLYSLASERVRTAFRIAYSLLDKVAFLVYRYWNLDKKQPDRISFKNVWMVEGKARLVPLFEKRDNLPLRGLFWLSKELFDEQLKQTTAADARELHAIRNALEHTYLRVSEGWAKPFMINGTNNGSWGIAIGSDELEAKTIRIMQMARSALFYVSSAIGVEERKKRLANPGQLIGSMPLFGLDDKRKRRDPC